MSTLTKYLFNPSPTTKIFPTTVERLNNGDLQLAGEGSMTNGDPITATRVGVEMKNYHYLEWSIL